MKVRAKKEREREKLKKKRLKESVRELKLRRSQRVQPPPSMECVESVENGAIDDSVETETPLNAHFRKKTLKFQSQTLDIADRLNQTFQEKQSFAKGQIAESLRSNHIKHQSLVNLMGVMPAMKSSMRSEHSSKCRKHKRHKKKHKKRRSSRRNKEYGNGADGVTGVPMLNV